LTKDAFGLPRIVNFSTKPKGSLTITLYPNPIKDGDKEMRRASPLHITVNKNKQNEYYCTLLILWDGLAFLPPNDLKIRIKKGNMKVSDYPILNNPGPEKLEAFLKKI
jgi:hypothetical protein